jgi:hypothetical protein
VQHLQGNNGISSSSISNTPCQQLQLPQQQLRPAAGPAASSSSSSSVVVGATEPTLRSVAVAAVDAGVLLGAGSTPAAGVAALGWGGTSLSASGLQAAVPVGTLLGPPPAVAALATQLRDMRLRLQQQQSAAVGPQ